MHEDQGSDADVEEDADSDVSDSCYARPMIGTSHSSGARESESKNVTSPDGDSIPNTAAKSNSAPNRLIVVANRLPINFSRNSKGEWTTGFASGGLVSAMNGVKADRMTWIGWVGTEIPPAAQPAIMQQCLLHNCYPVFMSKGTDIGRPLFYGLFLFFLMHFFFRTGRRLLQRLFKPCFGMAACTASSHWLIVICALPSS